MNAETAFDHAGVATDDAAALAERYTTLCGGERVHDETFDGMAVVFVDLGNGYIELLEPLDDGPVAGYLDDHGPGIHHLAVATNDIERALARARENGIELVDTEPRDGAWGHDVAFLHPESTGGVLFEFVERDLSSVRGDA